MEVSGVIERVFAFKETDTWGVIQVRQTTDNRRVKCSGHLHRMDSASLEGVFVRVTVKKEASKYQTHQIIGNPHYLTMHAETTTTGSTTNENSVDEQQRHREHRECALIHCLAKAQDIGREIATRIVKHFEGVDKTIALLDSALEQWQSGNEDAIRMLFIPRTVCQARARSLLTLWQLRLEDERFTNNVHDVESLLSLKYNFTKHQVNRFTQWNRVKPHEKLLDPSSSVVHLSPKHTFHKPLQVADVDALLQENPFLLLEAIDFKRCKQIAFDMLLWDYGDARSLAAFAVQALHKLARERGDMCASLEQVRQLVADKSVAVGTERLRQALHQEDAGVLLGIEFYEEQHLYNKMPYKHETACADYLVALSQRPLPKLTLRPDTSSATGDNGNAKRRRYNIGDYFQSTNNNTNSGGSTTIHVPNLDVYLQKNVLIADDQTMDERLEIIRRALERKQVKYQCDAVQIQAVYRALCNRVSVLVGGAGSGKTHTGSLIMEVMDEVGIVGCSYTAPTGMAARRCSEACAGKFISETIHRFILARREAGSRWAGMNVDRMRFLKFSFTYFLIIDEASMIPMEWIYMLLVALERMEMDVTLLFIGDPNQLPPIGAGKLLPDLISSLPTTRLERIYRQVGINNTIIDNAYTVLSDEKTPEHLVLDEKFEWIQDFDLKTVVDAITAEIRVASDYPTNILVLGVLKDGPLGIISLNKHLREIYNPNSRNKKPPETTLIDWKRSSSKKTTDDDSKNTDDAVERWEWRVGDYVMSTSNNYRVSFMNGETGTIVDIGMHEFPVGASKTEIKKGVQIKRTNLFGGGDDSDGLDAMFWLDLDDVRTSLNPAYACTTYKAQGSQAPLVFLVIDSSRRTFPYNMLTKQWAYTSITRAKKRVVLFSTRDHLATAMRESSNFEQRQSNLATRIINGLLSSQSSPHDEDLDYTD